MEIYKSICNKYPKNTKYLLQIQKEKKSNYKHYDKKFDKRHISSENMSNTKTYFNIKKWTKSERYLYQLNS
jgi:hypothetical protein